MMSGVRYPFASSIRLTAITISLLARLSGAPLTTGLFIGTPAESSSRIRRGVPHYSEPNLDFDATESGGQFLDGRGFLLALLRAAEAQKAPFFGGTQVSEQEAATSHCLNPWASSGLAFLSTSAATC